MVFKRHALILVPLLAALACACGGSQVTPPRALPIDPFPAAIQVAARAVAAADAAVDPSQFECEEIEPELFACPTRAHLDEFGWRQHLLEPEESTLAAPLDPPDPVQIRDGLETYNDLLHSVARRTRSHMELWEHTPVLNEGEIAYFQAHPEVWELTVGYRSTPAGRRQATAFEQAYNRCDDDACRRHLVLRDGVFYIEDPYTAERAARRLRLADLFDEPEIALERGSEHYVLERGGGGGDYYYTDPELGRYRARITMFDRVGIVGELEPLPSYRLSDLRERYGMSHIEVGAETGAGRHGEAVFLSGQRYDGLLVRSERSEPLLGLLASPSELREAVARGRLQGLVMYGLMDVAFAMVRENLFFDEPANEVGQQDGIMRLAFIDAFRGGATTYTVNQVTYNIYDEYGRPRPPQVCIDYITDTVERYTGRWFPEASQEATLRPQGVDLREYMVYRQVRRLVEVAETYPFVASLFSFKDEDQVPYRERDAFFENLWKHRDEFRIADVIVIYGLKADGRYHWHSFYVFDTDPVYGMPITITDQAGHAAIRSFHSVMSNAPRRSIRHRVRWNPLWVLTPDAVELAVSIRREAEQVVRRQLDPDDPLVAEGSRFSVCFEIAEGG